MLPGDGQGRQFVLKSARTMKLTDVLQRIDVAGEAHFLYHSEIKQNLERKRNIKNKRKQCYSAHKLRFNRYRPPLQEQYDQSNVTEVIAGPSTAADDFRRITRPRSKSLEKSAIHPSSKKVKKKVCIICNQDKIGKWPHQDILLYQIKLMKLGKTAASRFLSAVKYNQDDVSIRCALINSVGDVYAADLLYHKSCMGKYILKYNRMVQKIEDNQQRESNDVDFPEVAELFEGLQSETHGYRLTDITTEINKQFKLEFDNRRTKNELLKHFGDEALSFSYSTNWSGQSRQLYSNDL